MIVRIVAEAADELLDRIEGQLPGAFDLSFVFNRWTIGDAFLKDFLKFTTEQVEAPAFDLLNALPLGSRLNGIAEPRSTPDVGASWSVGLQSPRFSLPQSNDAKRFNFPRPSPPCGFCLSR